MTGNSKSSALFTAVAANTLKQYDGNTLRDWKEAIDCLENSAIQTEWDMSDVERSFSMEKEVMDEITDLDNNLYYFLQNGLKTKKEQGGKL